MSSPSKNFLSPEQSVIQVNSLPNNQGLNFSMAQTPAQASPTHEWYDSSISVVLREIKAMGCSRRPDLVKSNSHFPPSASLSIDSRASASSLFGCSSAAAWAFLLQSVFRWNLNLELGLLKMGLLRTASFKSCKRSSSVLVQACDKIHISSFFGVPGGGLNF